MSKPKPVDIKHQAALAARRVRDKKARDTLADSYIKKLMRQGQREHWADCAEIRWELVAAKRMVLAAHRHMWGRRTPEMNAAMKVHSEALARKIDSNAKRKA